MKQARQDWVGAALLGGLMLALLGSFLYVVFTSMTW